jgi:glycosyltransferase involved in cell wall biosynthesis
MVSSKAAPSTPPLVSVIVPTYNYGSFIGETLECLRAQTYENWECLVVDDGSTDDTADVVARFMRDDKRFKFLRQQNARQAAAKNNGLRNCAGEYIQFLDADDMIEPEKLEKHVGYLEAHPDVDIVYGSARYFRTENPGERLSTTWGDDKPWMPGISGSGKEVLLSLVRRNFLVINAALVRSSTVEAVGPFDERLPPAEDWDYWLRCAAAGARFSFDDPPGTLALVRWHPTSSSQDRRRMYASMLLMREKLETLMNDPNIGSVNRECAADDQEHLALETIAHGPFSDYVWQMLRAGRLNRRMTHRAKWFACACLAPFLPRRRLTALVTSSLTGSLTRPMHKN